MRKPLCLSILPAVLAAGLSWIAPARCAADEPMRVEPGLVLEVYVVGLPEFRYQVTVNPSGEASFPLLEPLQVAGMSLEAVRGLVKDRLSRVAYRQRTADGRENVASFLPEEITVDVVEYPPVYVTGDVAAPGQLAYRPGLTVRQAIALAGGYDLAPAGVGDAFMQAADLQGDYRQAAIELATAELRARVAQAVLANVPLDSTGDAGAGSAEVLPQQIARAETSRIEATEADYHKELAHIEGQVAEKQKRQDALGAEQQVQQETVQQQLDRVAQARDLNARGLAAASRVTEEVRQLAFAKERLLALSAEISAVVSDGDQVRRSLQSLQDQHRIGLLGDVEEATIRIASLKLRLRTLEGKLRHAAAAQDRSARADDLPRTISVHRKGATPGPELVMDEDETLRAGDVVEVRLDRSAANLDRIGE